MTVAKVGKLCYLQTLPCTRGWAAPPGRLRIVGAYVTLLTVIGLCWQPIRVDAAEPQEQEATIQNPVLRGFNPDPSILRVGDDYYIATSTFEWFPGVRIHHSRDLVHWRLLTHALTRKSQLDMVGNPPSGGVWAPCLSHHDGIFYLVFTNVRNCSGGFVDAHNYVVTSPPHSGALV